MIFNLSRFLVIIGIVLASIVIAILAVSIFLIFDISLWWIISLMPIDAVIIALLVNAWEKEDKEKDEEALSFFQDIDSGFTPTSQPPFKRRLD